jgi:hypothetical protein
VLCSTLAHCFFRNVTQCLNNHCVIFTRAYCWALSWTKWIQFTHSPLLCWKSNFNVGLSNMVTWCWFQYSYFVVALTVEAMWLSLWQSQEPFLFFKALVNLGLNQPPGQWVPASVSIGMKQLRHQAGCSPPLTADIKNAWSSASTPTLVYKIWCFNKHGVNLALTLYIHIKYHTTK